MANAQGLEPSRTRLKFQICYLLVMESKTLSKVSKVLRLNLPACEMNGRGKYLTGLLLGSSQDSTCKTLEQFRPSQVSKLLFPSIVPSP